jgi:hypothetical protein
MANHDRLRVRPLSPLLRTRLTAVQAFSRAKRRCRDSLRTTNLGTTAEEFGSWPWKGEDSFVYVFRMYMHRAEWIALEQMAKLTFSGGSLGQCTKVRKQDISHILGGIKCRISQKRRNMCAIDCVPRHCPSGSFRKEPPQPHRIGLCARGTIHRLERLVAL